MSTFTNIRPHKVFEHKEDENVYAMCLTEGPHADIVFSYGKVSFEEDEDNDKLIVHFEYEIHDDKMNDDYDLLEFEQELGHFLLELLEKGVRENSNVYTGGSDEVQ